MHQGVWPNQYEFLMPLVPIRLVILVYVEYNHTTTKGLVMYQFCKNGHFISLVIPMSYKNEKIVNIFNVLLPPNHDVAGASVCSPQR